MSPQARSRRGASGVRRFSRYAWGLVALAVLAAVAYAAIERALGPHVGVVRPHRGELVQTVVTSGRVLPPTQVTLTALVPGTVTAVEIDDGSRIKAGQLLVQIDPREAEAAVAQAKAAQSRARAQRHQVHSVTAEVANQSLDQARTRVEQKKLDYQRETALFASGSTTKSALDDAGSALAVARSQLASAEAQAKAAAPGGVEARLASAAIAQADAELAAANARLERTRVVAPTDGVVLLRAVDPGDVVQPGTELVRLVGVGRTQLVVEPDEKNLALLAVGQPAKASAEAFPDQRFDAKLAFIAPGVDPQRGTVQVKLDVDAPPAYLRPSMTVSVEIEVARKKNALVLDAGAVRALATPHPWLLVVDGNRARHVDVKLGIKGDQSVEITGGVSDGAQVIPPGDAHVEAGQRLRPAPDEG